MCWVALLIACYTELFIARMWLPRFHNVVKQIFFHFKLIFALHMLLNIFYIAYSLLR